MASAVRSSELTLVALIGILVAGEIWSDCQALFGRYERMCPSSE